MNQYQRALHAIQPTKNGKFYNYELMIMRNSLEKLIADTIIIERKFRNWCEGTAEWGEKVSSIWPQEDPNFEWVKPDSFQMKLKDQDGD